MSARQGPEGSASSGRNRPLLSWLCLLAVPLLFELPAVLTTTALSPEQLRLSLEVPLALTLWLLSLRSPDRLSPILLRAAATILVLYRVDQWVCWTLLRDEPLLYDQFFMMRHLWALLGDLMSATTAMALAALAAGGFALGFLVRALLRRASALATAGNWRRTARLLALGWCVLLVLRLSELGRRDPLVTWLTPTIARNVRKSFKAYAAMHKRLRRSPYAAYQKVALRDKPDVLLFIVESYGRLLSVEAGTRARHARLLSELEQELRQAGFHAASAFATATVSGGRSWIAEGTMLMGTPIRYEAVFQHIVAQKPPNFVGFLAQNGYDTVLLAPADRARAGLRSENRYGFTRLITYDELGYTGPSVGWGLVPDQFSLAFVERELLGQSRRPLFLDFHMVSSHAPWSEVPALMDDPQRLLAQGGERRAQPAPDDGDVLMPLRRYYRNKGRFMYMHHFDEAMRSGYQASIEYDLRTISQYLARRPRDAFVIVLGDHQPPVIAREDESFDAPIHVLSRDPARLAPLLSHGFVPGLTLAPDAPPALAHAGFFSLWVHALAAMGCDGCAPPRVLPQGDWVLNP